MGVSLREYITAERMKATKALLEQGELRVQDVAERVGGHDVKHPNPLRSGPGKGCR